MPTKSPSGSVNCWNAPQMGAVRGGTTYLWNGYGAQSSTSTCTSTFMPAWARQNPKLLSTWTGTTWVGRIQVWKVKRPIRLTGTNCLSWPASWQWLRKMETCGAPRVAYRVGRLNASDHRRLGQLCTVRNPQSSTYRSVKVVQTNRATSLPRIWLFAIATLNSIITHENQLILIYGQFPNFLDVRLVPVS